MENTKHLIITINRLNGSGGRSLGQALAERLGIAFLDKQILDDAAKELGVTRDDVNNLMERKPRWWDDFRHFYSNAPIGDVRDEREVTARNVYQTQCNIMKELAAEGPCVIVGRGAFEVFREYPNTLRVFIHASENFRINRLKEKRGLSESEARELLKKNDEIREKFTQEYSGKSRYDARNYDLSIDVEKATVEQTIKLLESIVKTKL
ncbi:MAG: cytidylate kinase-like family protein [Paludibacteraceae bacterium]|nr:cytidylate kinase-like family protein [Paludibacteraceae bacterium]